MTAPAQAPVRPRPRLGLKTAAAFGAWTLALVLLGARGAMRGAASKAELARPLPEFAMTAVTPEAEAPFGLADLLGSPWVASFLYTSCAGPCPLVAAELAELQDALPSEVRIVSFTVDPDRDDADRLRRYAERLGARPDRWTFARGDKGALYKLMYEGFRLPLAEDPAAPPEKRVTHSTKLALVDARGVLRGLYDRPEGLPALRRDAARLLEDNVR